MRIGYLCHDQLPGASTSTEQLLNNVSRLVERGFEIDVIAPTHQNDARPTAERAPEIAAFYGMPPDAFKGQMRLIELPFPRWIGGNLRRGLLDIAGARWCARQQYDLIYVRDAFPLVTALASALPVVFETYRTDFNRNRKYALWRWFCYRRSNLIGIVTHSEIARASFLERGIPEDAVLVSHNGYSPEVMQPRLSREEARAKLGLPVDAKYVTYTGHVNERKGLEVVFSVAQRLPGVTFCIVGVVPGSSGAEWVHSRIEDAGLANVMTVPRVPPSDVPTWLYSADVLIVPPSSDPLTRFSNTVLPMKTFLYLAAGRPIVAGDMPDIREVLVDGRNAALVPPDDIDAAAAAVSKSLFDIGFADTLSRQALADAEGYTWEARSHRIAGFVRERLSAH